MFSDKSSKTMTNLTQKQIEQAQDLIKQYGFCSLETQGKLQEAGFFEKQVVLHYIVFPNDTPEIREPFTFVVVQGDIDFYAENGYHFIPMPIFNEIWKQLKPEIVRKGDRLHKCLGAYTVYYESSTEDTYNEDGESSFIGESIENNNETEAAARLWLLLHKEGLTQ